MEIYWQGKHLDVEGTLYLNNDQLALVLKEDGRQYGVATVAIPGAVLLPGQVIVDQRFAGLEWALVEGGIIKRNPDTWTQSGYCAFPIYNLTEQAAVELFGLEP